MKYRYWINRKSFERLASGLFSIELRRNEGTSDEGKFLLV